MTESSILKRTISQKFGGLIWKINTSASGGLLAVESRDPVTKAVVFSVIDYESGRVRLLEREFGTGGNLSLWHLTDAYMTLKVFDENQFAESRGLLVIDINSGKLISEIYHLSPDYANEHGIRVFDPRIQPRRYYWIDYEGNPIREPQDETTVEILYPGDMSDVHLPEFISGSQIIGPVSQLLYQDLSFISFHQKAAELLEQRLIVIQDNNILLDELMNQAIQNLQPEAFFIQNYHLFYIRGKQEIVSYLITP